MISDFRLKKNEYLIICDVSGKDALDFIIDSFLGFKLNELGKLNEYVIISKDNGFKNIQRFWGSQGYIVKCVEPIIESESLFLKRPHSINKVKFVNTAHPIYKKYRVLPSKLKLKIRNIYTSWFRSRNQDKDTLLKDLQHINMNGLLSNDEVIKLCDFLYEEGL
jgi:hypothetical protein